MPRRDRRTRRRFREDTPSSCSSPTFVSFVGTKNRPEGRAPGGGEEGRDLNAVKAFLYEARAARRCGTTGTTAAFTGLATFARAVARASFRALTMKHRSSALS